MVDVPLEHPGEHLGEIIEDLGLSPTEFEQATGIDGSRLAVILEVRAPITADVAVRIGKALDMMPEFWLSLQSDYNLESESEEAFSKSAIARMRSSLCK